MMRIDNKVEINSATLELLPSLVIKLRYKQDYEIELKDVKQVERAFLNLAEEKDIYCLMDMTGKFNTITKEAQKFISKEASIVREKKLIASAVVIDNLSSRIITKIFVKLFKPPFKMKIFSTVSNGEAWLVKLRKTD